MSRFTSYVQYHPNQVIGVLLVLFVVLLALSIIAWYPKDVTSTGLHSEVLDMHNLNTYTLDTLPTPRVTFSNGALIPKNVYRVVNSEDDAKLLPQLQHLEHWEERVFTSKQCHEFVTNTFGNTWPDIVHAYNLCRLFNMQQTIFKYLIVYQFGGLCIDANVVTSSRLDDLVKSAKALVSGYTPPKNVELFGAMTQGQGEFQTWWVMAPPRSEFLWQVVWQVVRNVFAFHTSVPTHMSRLSGHVDVLTGGICYTYVASKYPQSVSICKNDFLELQRSNALTKIDNMNTQISKLPVHLVYVQNQKPTTTVQSKHLIPAIIHQTNETRWVTPAMAETIMQVRSHAPMCEYRFYDAQERRAFIEQHYPCALDAYDALVPGAFRADLFRMIVVYTHGGTYIDMGMAPYPRTSLYEHVLDTLDEFVIPIDVWPYGLFNAFFAATAHHPYLKLIITHILDNITSRKTFASNPYGMFHITGPRACEHALRHVLSFPLKEGKYGHGLSLLRYYVVHHPTTTDQGISKTGRMLYKRKYETYYADQHLLNRDIPHYSILWKQNKIYNVQSDFDFMLKQPIKCLPFSLPVIYINMDRSKGRNKRVLKELSSVSQNITRVPAIDGSNAKAQNVLIISDYTDLTPGEIGCTASHLKAIRFAYNMKWDRVLICEDDVSFAPMRVWQQSSIDTFFDSISDDVGMVLLSWGGNEYGSSLLVRRIEANSSLFGTVAYVLTHKGMSDILSHAHVNIDTIHLRATDRTPNGRADGYLYNLTTLADSSVPLAVADNTEHKTEIHDRPGGDHDFMQHEWFVKCVNKVYSVAIKNAVIHKPDCLEPFDLSRALNYIQTRPTMLWPKSIPIVYINLDRSPERRTTLQAQLSSMQATGERVVAFDGKTFDKQTNSIGNVTITCDFNLTPCELGCTASHLVAIKKAFDMDVPYVLICEDDVSFASMGVWTQDVIDTFLCSVPSDIGILLLYWGGYTYRDSLHVSPLSSTSGVFSTCAYIITRRGMQHVLAHATVTSSKIHWSKTHVDQNGQADNYLFSVTNIATSGVPLLMADNMQYKTSIDDREQDHDSYQFKDFTKAVKAINLAACKQLTQDLG